MTLGSVCGNGMPEVYHETVYFAGRVQGVGFRYTTFQVAKEFEVCGWVQNLADGRVQLEVEGTKAAIQQFVVALEERMHGYIKNADRKGGFRAGEFSGFTIR